MGLLLDGANCDLVFLVYLAGVLNVSIVKYIVGMYPWCIIS